MQKEHPWFYNKHVLKSMNNIDVNKFIYNESSN